MARIRSVHPSLFSDENWVSCSTLARLLWIGLCTEADDQGVFEWKPIQLKMRILPGDNVDINELIAELSAHDLIRKFEANGNCYGAIKDFLRHQRPRRPTHAHPLPTNMVAYVTGDVEQHGLFDEDDGANVQRSCAQMSGIDSHRRGEEGKGEERKVGGVQRGTARKARRPETPIPDGFPGQDEFELAKEICTAEQWNVDIPWEGKRFRSWAEKNDSRYRDWRACWRGWIERTIQWSRDSGKPSGNVVPITAVSEERQRVWMQDWMAAPHQWRVADRGPPPDRDGCKISAKIMAEHGYAPPLHLTGSV